MMQHCRSLPDLAFDVGRKEDDGTREDGGTREDAGFKRRYKLYKVWGLSMQTIIYTPYLFIKKKC